MKTYEPSGLTTIVPVTVPVTGFVTGTGAGPGVMGVVEPGTMKLATCSCAGRSHHARQQVARGRLAWRGGICDWRNIQPGRCKGVAAGGAHIAIEGYFMCTISISKQARMRLQQSTSNYPQERAACAVAWGMQQLDRLPNQQAYQGQRCCLAPQGFQVAGSCLERKCCPAPMSHQVQW